VQLDRAGQAGPMQPRQILNEGDIIRTGDGRASVTMHFARDGVLTLGSNSQFFVNGASPPSLGRGDVLRVQLIRGELTLDAYPASNTVPKDYRINIGPLQVRALGADMWAYNNGNSEVVCLHQGAVEITGSVGEQRLDFVGDCVQHRTGGPLQFLPGGETELKDRMLTPVQNSPSATTIAVVAAGEPAPANVAVKVPTPTPPPASITAMAPVAVASAAPAAPAPAPHKAANHGMPRWVIVLATAGNRSTADDLAYKFGKRTLRTTVRESGKAQQPFSVTFGDFASKKEADKFARKLQRKYRLKIVRVAALS
jgi:hypothetical protein